MGDPNFERTVVLVCRHDEEGSFGLVLNRKSNLKLSDVLDIYQNSERYGIEYWRPHAIQYLALYSSGRPIGRIYCVGRLRILGRRLRKIKSIYFPPVLLRRRDSVFFGLSGWSPGQLEEEIENKVWIVNNKATNNLFNLNQDSLWREILKQMGGKYKVLANYPIDPSLN